MAPDLPPSKHIEICQRDPSTPLGGFGPVLCGDSVVESTGLRGGENGRTARQKSTYEVFCCGLGAGREMECGKDCNSTSTSALDEVQPLPPMEATRAAQTQQPKGEDAGEGSCNGICSPEQSIAESHLSSCVELAQIKGGTRNESRLEGGQEEAKGPETCSVGKEHLTPGDSAPTEHQSGKPSMCSKALDGNVTGYLEDYHAEGEQGLSSVDIPLVDANVSGKVVGQGIPCGPQSPPVAKKAI